MRMAHPKRKNNAEVHAAGSAQSSYGRHLEEAGVIDSVDKHCVPNRGKRLLPTSRKMCTLSRRAVYNKLQSPKCMHHV